MECNREANPQLLEDVMQILYRNGLKATTMDYVAAQLGISKRTLYETFPTKRDMIGAVLDYDRESQSRLHSEIFRREPNLLLAMINIFLEVRRTMDNINSVFFRDMDEYFPEIRKRFRNNPPHLEMIERFYQRGIDEGVFRKDVNIRMTWVLVHIQFEALKRMEENFPPGMTFIEAFDSIALGFMRGIVSAEGMKVLDAVSHRFNTVKN